MSGWTRIAYACTLLVAVILAFAISQNRQASLKLSLKERWTLALSAFVGATFGSKMPFLLDDGWEALFRGTIWFADGKTILGGIFGGYFAVELAKYIFSIRVRTGDSFAIPVASAVCVGRIGCFIAGCCYGKTTTLPWGVDFHLAIDPQGTLRHPTQLYEFLFHAIAIVALVICNQRKWLLGNQLKAYLIAYLIFRFITEWIRPEPTYLLELTNYQIAAILFTAILIALWIWQGPIPSEKNAVS